MAAKQLVVPAENGEVPHENILAAINDDFDGVIVEMNEAMDPTLFHSMLRASLSQWRQQGKKGVWIKLPIQLANLVEFAVKEGFWYHHAEPTYIMLVYWIPESKNTIPANATHRVRVGAFVMNEKKEVLVVQEKTGNLRGSGVWKFPTGVVDEGEDICHAATREVKEETGIDSEFVEILTFRQTHKSFYEKSDLFFVCILRPLSFDIQVQELEIEAATIEREKLKREKGIGLVGLASENWKVGMWVDFNIEGLTKWMKLEEYEAQPFVQNHEIRKRFTEIYKAKVDGVYAGFSPLLTESIFSDAKSYLYFNEKGLKKMH